MATLMGGGFGGKEDIAGQIHVSLLAQATQQPVKCSIPVRNRCCFILSVTRR